MLCVRRALVRRVFAASLRRRSRERTFFPRTLRDTTRPQSPRQDKTASPWGEIRARSTSPIETSKTSIAPSSRSASPTAFPIAEIVVPARSFIRLPGRADLHQAPRLRAVKHNRGARESESCGDGGRSGSFAMTIAATALGPRVRPAAVAVGPRGSTRGGTVGAIATAVNRQKCLRRRAPGATIARLDARRALGVGAGALRRGRGDAVARGARAYRLQVNAHGDHDHGTSLSPLPRPTRHAARQTGTVPYL